MNDLKTVKVGYFLIRDLTPNEPQNWFYRTNITHKKPFREQSYTYRQFSSW